MSVCATTSQSDDVREAVFGPSSIRAHVPTLGMSAGDMHPAQKAANKPRQNGQRGPGVGGDGGVGILHGAALKHAVAHGRQLRDDGQVQPQALRLQIVVQAEFIPARLAC